MRSLAHWSCIFGSMITLTSLDSVIGASSQRSFITCDESVELFKSIYEDLQLQCPDSTGNCIWYHVVNDTVVPIEARFKTTDGSGDVNLRGDDPFSFGNFIANTTDISQCNSVCPGFNDNSK